MFLNKIIVLCLFIYVNVSSQSYLNKIPFETTPKKYQDTCKIGMYISNLYDFNIENNCYTIDFWLWINFENDSLDFSNPYSVENSREIKCEGGNLFKKHDKMNWVTQFYSVIMLHNWNLDSYPFDKQTFKFQIEDNLYYTSELKYILDTINSGFNKDILYDNYEKINFKQTISYREYDTNFGNPSYNEGTKYPIMKVEINLVRINRWITFYKLILGAYVSFMISLMVFFIHPSNVDPRFGLCVGGLFATIGNKYIVETNVPASASLTLIDQLHNLTFLMILCIVIISIISLNLSKKKNTASFIKKLDMSSFYIILTIYIIANLISIWLA